MSDAASSGFQFWSWLAVSLGILASVLITIDLLRRQPQPMFVMNLVWPINALWAGPVGLWMYWTLGRTPPRSNSGPHKMDMDMAPRSFWKKVVAGTLHCGAGCTLADLIGPFVFAAMPFAVLDSLVYGEWTLDYMLALIVGVSFQYMALAPMLQQHGARIW